MGRTSKHGALGMGSRSLERLALVAMTLLCAFLLATRDATPAGKACDLSPQYSGLPNGGQSAAAGGEQTWFEVARTTPTDKITKHAYDVAYDKYLPRYRTQPRVKLLEIGLGCNMGYGPGASLRVWQEYFKNTNLELHFLEYDRPCAEKWQPKYPDVKFHIGDQASFHDLQKVIDDSGGQFDIIIDDGGHTMKQQIHTIEYMIPHALKPGGIFIMEDLITSFEGPILPKKYDPRDYGTNITTEFICSIIDDMHKASYYPSARLPRSNWMYQHILGVYCIRGLCVFEKMPPSSELSPSMINKDKP